MSMWDQNPGFFGFPTARDDASICLFGAPFDGTCSGHAGSRFAPKAIRDAAHFLEVYSPIQDKNVDEIRAIDVGDLPIPIGNTPASLALIKEAVSSILAKGQRPAMLGGEHLCTLPAIEAMLEVYPDLVVIQFDAHTDLRDEYLGETLSHATVMRRVLERLPDPKNLITYGLRSGLQEEFRLANQCRPCGPPHALLAQRLSGLRFHLEALHGRPFYITFDLDIFDPALLPGTGTPEPGGIMFEEVTLFLPFLQKQKIVGLDIVELCPPIAPTDASAILAAKICRELLLLMATN